MKVYGLTGGLGSGKSTVRALFEQLDVPGCDADQAARDVVAPNSPGLVKIRSAFGPQVCAPDGTLDRARMRQRILDDPNAKRTLESITHPLIRQRLADCVAQLKTQHPKAIVVEIPLLVETGKPDFIDQVIVCDLPESLQKQRALARARTQKEAQKNAGKNTMTPIQVDAILKSQASRADRLAQADWVIDTSQPKKAVLEQIKELLAANT
ncbi:dephospho-CoA kinase [Hydrogenovibrio halophilus]|uniref:dephospho-CoA kinase n=1 Tax=Hydrogenovibrio halophilus TaxID=373391 RepID=UPI00036643EF|nr:dephospho-CoA kinase [Hydrogenovibrio halophilus]